MDNRFVMPLRNSRQHLFSWGELRVCWAVCERPEFESFPRGVVSRCVHVRLPKDYHPDVRVQVNLAGLGAGQPEVDEVSEPLPRIRVAVALFAWHVQCALPQECLGRGRHVGKIVHDHKHLDHSAQGVEESQLNGSFLWHSVSLLAKVDMAQVGRSNSGVFTQGVEEDSNREGQVPGLEGP